MPALPAPPLRGVVFDFHHTLVHGGDPAAWVQDAWALLGRRGDPRERLADAYRPALAFLDRIWEHARDVDPDSERDLDPTRHREVFDRTIARAPGVDPELADALYRTMQDQWDAYDDTVPVLEALRDGGFRVVVLSNVGYDLTRVLDRTGIAALLDGTVLSFRLGTVKPDAGIFRAALDVIGMPAEEVLMVGDSWADDGAGAGLGMRTLILPRTDGPVHGLELVLRVAGVEVPRVAV